jgi:glycosyltransferase involved in cell wall biosynthesis
MILPGGEVAGRISVVVPSYNQAEYLDEALNSLLSQDYPDVEVIVMDGGSTDGSVETIRKYAEKLAYWRSAPDGGQAQAIHEGFQLCTGSIIGWLNSDDRLFPGALTQIAAAFCRDPSCQWVYGDTEVIDVCSKRVEVRRTIPVDLFDLVNLSYYLPQESSYFRRSLYFQSPGINASLHYAMDYDLWLKFARIVEPQHVDAIVGAFRYRPGQKSGDAAAYRAEEIRVKADYSALCLSRTESLKRLVRLKATTLRRRVRIDGLAPVATKLIRTLRGQGPKLGASRSLAAVLVLGPLLGSVCALVAGWRLVRSISDVRRRSIIAEGIALESRT